MSTKVETAVMERLEITIEDSRILGTASSPTYFDCHGYCWIFPSLDSHRRDFRVFTVV